LRQKRKRKRKRKRNKAIDSEVTWFSS
jgi:hypothetical protein